MQQTIKSIQGDPKYRPVTIPNYKKIALQRATEIRFLGEIKLLIKQLMLNIRCVIYSVTSNN